ncbi:hypothetical protein TorRG33x02_253200 [Trema orientale]|uniref:Uncharacterized protein n=1 Tax=Trema orientale TaxID=63057 RepID=A0A2P5DF28_TREOI|nr:hypothetical protein TorRG33x02_253200 [Trema orientale]
MASPLDHYTTAFLLYAYGINECRLKPNLRSETNAIDLSLNLNSGSDTAVCSSFKGVNHQDAVAGSSFNEVNVQGAHGLVHGIRASAGAYGVVHDLSGALGSMSANELNTDCPRIISDGNVLESSAREIAGGGLAAGVAQKSTPQANI